MSGELERSRKVASGIGRLLVVAGTFYVLQWHLPLFGFGDFVLCLLTVAVGAGLIRRWRWARWMGMGLSFLMLAAPLTLPLLFLEWRPYAGMEKETELYLMFCAFGAASALAGNRGLSYFRSDLARRDFGGDLPAGAGTRSESSAVAVYTAMVWLAAMLLAGLFDGLIKPDGPPHRRAAAASREAARAPAARPPSLEESEPVLDPANDPGHDLLYAPELRARLLSSLPDLEVLGLCYEGINTVYAVIMNHGGIRNAVLPDRPLARYILRFTDLRFHGTHALSWGRVPPPGSCGLVTLDNTLDAQERDSAHLYVETLLDPDDRIKESDKTNNRKVFRIEYRYMGATNLPACAKLRQADSLIRLDAPL